MYICFATSDAYAMYAGISMGSFLRTNSDMKIEKIFILDFGIKQKNIEKLKREADKYNRLIEFIQAKEKMEKLTSEYNVPIFRGSLATYSRVFIEYLIPDYVNKLFLIDCDTVTIGSAKELELLQMEYKAVAAVIQTSWYGRKGLVQEFRENSFDENNMYLNCGMVLYNLDFWRKERCSEILFDYMRKKKNFLFADQTIINFGLPQSFLYALHPKFNYMGHVYSIQREMPETDRGNWYSKKIYNESIENPIIVHYPGISPKPWYNESISRRIDDYLFAKSKSEWRDVPQESMKEEIKRKYPSIRGRLLFWFAYWKNSIKSVWFHDLVQNIVSNFKRIHGKF